MKRTNTSFTLLEGMLLAAIVAILIPSCSNKDPGNGQSIGSIVKIAKQGVLNRTYEGELIRGGLNAGSGVMGKPFDFTIREKDVKAVQEYMEKETEVIITYTRPLHRPLWSSGSGAFLETIKPAHATTEKENK